MDQTLEPPTAAVPRRRLLDRFLFLMMGPKGKPKDLDSNLLAVERTRLAYERTMMAWIRTGLSLISFGFTIYKFFQFRQAEVAVREGLIGARGFAMMMIVTGLCAVLLAGLQHRTEMQSLRASGIEVPPSLATIVGGLVSLLGIVGLLAVVFKQ